MMMQVASVLYELIKKSIPRLNSTLVCDVMEPRKSHSPTTRERRTATHQAREEDMRGLPFSLSHSIHEDPQLLSVDVVCLLFR